LWRECKQILCQVSHRHHFQKEQAMIGQRLLALRRVSVGVPSTSAQASASCVRHYNDYKNYPADASSSIDPSVKRSEREIAMQNKIDKHLQEMKLVGKMKDTRASQTGLPLPSKYNLPDIRFDVTFEAAPVWKVTKAKRYTVGPNGIHDVRPIPQIAYYPVQEPARVLREKPEALAAAKRLYEPLFKRFYPYLKDIENLENFDPEVLENLIRNDGVLKEWDFNGAGLHEQKVEKFTGAKTKVKKVSE
jgi:hypothetical protein